ncbi:MAG TPA: AAA family ATPase, partial [Ktedonobacterales bacterium]
MARTTPNVHQGVLDAREGAQAIVVDSPAWFVWLSRHRVFRFASSVGTLTARKERRAASWYWYAYRRQRGVLRSAYLGKSEEVTLARLMRIASVFHGASLQCTASAETAEATEERSLLTTKMTPPMRSSSTIDRPRLLALLRMRDSSRLLLVTGPAGSGKTTLLSAWLREDSRPVAWVSLHEEENDPARFWGYVLAALHMRYPDIAAHTMTLLPTLQDRTMEQFLIPLINALALLPDDLTLVLDDYHVVTNPQVQESVAFLLEHAPARLHLAIASRSLPALPLARLRAQGLLGEVDFDDLRFTREEAAALFQVVTGHAPEPEQLAHLLGSTEGWATGLYLAALAWDGASASALYPSLPHGNHRYIFDYLASEVLARQPTQMRDFLVQTSILDHVYGPLCDAVLLRDDSQRMLEQ